MDERQTEQHKEGQTERQTNRTNYTKKDMNKEHTKDRHTEIKK